MDSGIIIRGGTSTLREIVNARVEFHIAGTVEERIAQLTAPLAPFFLVDKIFDIYRLRSKAKISDQNFVYTNVDEEMVLLSPVHRSAQEALGFSSGSYLTVNECRLDTPNRAGFKEIGDYLSAKGIPYYVVAVARDMWDVLLGGHNPLNGTTLWQH